MLPGAHSCQLEAGRACGDDRCWQTPWGPCCLPKRLLPSCGLLVLSREATALGTNSRETERGVRKAAAAGRLQNTVLRETKWWDEGREKNPASVFPAKYCVLPPFLPMPILGLLGKSRPLPPSHTSIFTYQGAHSISGSVAVHFRHGHDKAASCPSHSQTTPRTARTMLLTWEMLPFPAAVGRGLGWNIPYLTSIREPDAMHSHTVLRSRTEVKERSNILCIRAMFP